MKKITKTVPCLSALCLLALVAAAPAAPQPVDEPERMTALAEQIEIMRLVLAKSINRGFTDLIAERRPPQDPIAAQEAEVLAQRFGDHHPAALRLLRVYGRVGHQKTQFTSHTRGFYAEGIGVVFSSEVQTPVSELEGEAAVKAAREPDEWNEAAEEISGRAGGAIGRATVYWDAVTTAQFADTDDPVLWAIEPEFVEAAISSVLTMLGKHGLKIEALPEDEGIVVGLRLEPDVRLTSYSVGTGNEPATELAYAYMLMNRTLHAGARRAAPMHLVIQISKRSLERFGAQDEVDVAALRHEARITMYGGDPGAGHRGATGVR